MKASLPGVASWLLRSLLATLLFAWFRVLAASPAPVHLMRTPQNGVQPEVAVDSRGNVHLVYLKGDPKGCDVMYALRRTGEAGFATPAQVNNEPGCAVALGTVRGAQLALGRNGFVHVVWNGSQPAREPGAKGAPMWYARLDRTGRRLVAQRNLMTSTMNLDGGGAVAADARGNVYAVWHAHDRNGPEDEAHRAVYVAKSADDGLTFAPERKITSGEVGVCGCCGLKALAEETGSLAVLYRSADDRGDRDSMLLISHDGGGSFESVLLGKWHSSTCPMSTPALGSGPRDELFAMWETEGQIYRRLLGPRMPSVPTPDLALDENPGNRKHPAFALSHAHGLKLLTAWVEGTGWDKGGSVAWECADLKTNAKTSGRRPGVPPWDFAAVFPEPDGSFTILY